MIAQTAGPELVGRDDALAAVRAAIEGIRSRHSSALAFVGDPGIGKSSVLARGVAEATAVALPMFLGSGRRRTLRCPSGPAALRGQPLPWSTLAAALRHATTDGQHRRHGAVVVLDDIHDATAEQVSDLAELVATTAEQPVLIMLAYRPRQLPSYAAAFVADAIAAGRLELHTLQPLPAQDAPLVVPGHPDPVWLHEQAGGNPQYMRLLADVCEAAGAIRGELARLRPDELLVAQAAAAFGGGFASDLLLATSTLDKQETVAAIDGLLAADILRQQRPPLLEFRHPVVARIAHESIPFSVRRLLHGRIEAELRRRGASPTDRAPHIVHADGITDTEQIATLIAAAREMQRCCTLTSIKWLEAARAVLPIDDKRSPIVQFALAQTRLLAGDLEGSREALRELAAKRCHTADAALDIAATSALAELHLGRYDEADTLVRAGLAVSAGPHRSTSTLLVGLAEVATSRSAYSTAAQYTVAATRIARQHGDRTGEVVALGTTAFAQVSSGDLGAAAVAVAAAAQIIDATSDATASENLSSLYEVALGELLLERFIDAERHLTRGLALARRTKQRYILPYMLKSLGECHFRRGLLEPAIQELEEAASYDRNGLRPATVLAGATRAQALALLRADDDVTECYAAVNRVLSVTSGVERDWAIVARCNAAEALVLSGERERGRQVLLESAGGSGLPWVSPARFARLFEILVITTPSTLDIAGANRQHLSRIDGDPAISVTLGRRGYVARTRIRLSTGGPFPAGIASAAADAIASFHIASMPLEVCRTHIAIATAKLDQGDRDGVAGHLRSARALAVEFGAGQLGKEVSAQSARLVQDIDWRARLSTREAEVATLAAAGLTSADIGDRLQLSARTIDSHLGRIYQKLGVPNRLALADVVTADGLDD